MIDREDCDITSFSERSAGSPRRWFVTGGSGGLGRALVEHALDQGEHVTATVRRPDALDDLRARFGAQLTVEMLDLGSPEAVREVIGRTIRTTRVDVVVNNAGYAVVGAAEEMSDDQVRDQIEVLLLAPMSITRAFLQPMREQGGGRIFQISSMGGQVAVPTHSAYHAGKWGLEGFTESVAREVSDFGIRLTLIEPGATRTGFGAALRFTAESGVYRDNAVGLTRQALRAQEASAFTGDPAKIAAAVFDVSRDPDPPLRLAFGADAYDGIHTTLTERLTRLQAQEKLAASIAYGR